MRTSIRMMTAAAVAVMMAFTANAVTVTVEASGPGKVSPAGSVEVAAGKTLTLKATPNKDAVFVRWSNNERTPTRKVTPTGNMTCTAYFVLKSTCAAPAISSFTASASNMVGMPYAAQVNINSTAYPVKFSAKGLPKGLKIDANTGAVTGVPAEAKAYSVTFTAKSVANPAYPVATSTRTISIAALPEKAQGTFSGSAEIGMWRVRGAVTATVSAKGKISVKAVTTTGTYTFSAPSWTSRSGSTYTLQAQTKKGDAAITLNVDSNAAWNYHATATGTLVGGGSTYALYAQRNPFLDKNGTAYNTAVAELTARYAGYYTVGLPYSSIPEQGPAIMGTGILPYGSGYLTLTVSDKGVVKAAGKMADGTSVSASMPLWITAAEGRVYQYVPLYAKRGFASWTLMINKDNGTVSGYGDWSYPGKSPTAKVPLTGDHFRFLLNSLYGARYTPPPAGYTETIVCRNELGDFPFFGASKGKYAFTGVLAPLFTGVALALNPKTGVFMGKIGIVDGGKKITLSHTGVRIQRTASPCGAGYITLPSHKYEAYNLKHSDPVQLRHP
ncbi:MAG: putative Ig domain-containing protein [Kiritimatiellaeota bacterium]|nr:putative Ig domain-containing protein [Kiritimatiellota bacterium]